MRLCKLFEDIIKKIFREKEKVLITPTIELATQLTGEKTS